MSVARALGVFVAATFVVADANAAAAPASAATEAQVIAQAAALPTPRTRAGQVDLSGYWTAAIARNPTPQVQREKLVSADGKVIQLGIPAPEDVRAGEIEPVARRRANSSLRPAYKPEYAAKALEFFDKANQLDPTARCAPPGVPRIGMPAEIVQTDKAVFLLYPTRNYFRIIPTDGRGHDPDADSMNMGDAVGRWEKDSLVIESVNFNEDTWLDGDGSFHTANMRVIERFTRRGNTLNWQATVEDPSIMLQPWSPPARTLVLGRPDQHIAQDYPCVERDIDHYVNGNRH